MIETEALVVTASGRTAMVRPAPHSPCGQCDPVHGCRSMSLARLFSRRDIVYSVVNDVAASPGDKVIVAVHEKALLLSAALLYVFPLVSLLTGALLGRLFGEWASVLLGVLLFALALLFLRSGLDRRLVAHWMTPHIARRINPSIIVMERRSSCHSKS